MNIKKLNPDQSGNELSLFEAHSVKLDQLFRALNVPHPSVDSIRERVFPVFAKLGLPEQQTIIEKLRFYIEICETAVEQDFRGIGDKRLSWYALRKLELTPPGELFGQIDNNECLEIYDGQGIQMFRNFNFCQHVSYSIQECVTFSWDELYKRDEKILGIMHERAGQALMQAKSPFPANIPRHFTYEIKSDEMREYDVKFKTISPLFGKTHQTSAFLVTSNIRVSGSRRL